RRGSSGPLGKGRRACGGGPGCPRIEQRGRSSALPSPELRVQAVQGLVLGDNAAVLIAPVDDVRQVADQIAYVLVRDDYERVQRREEPPVGGVLAAQVVRVFEVVGVVPQLVADTRASARENAAQEADVI